MHNASVLLKFGHKEWTVAKCPPAEICAGFLHSMELDSLLSSSYPSCFTFSYLLLLISFSLPSLSPSIHHSQSTFSQHWLNSNSLSVVSSAVTLPAIKLSSLDTVTVFKVAVKSKSMSVDFMRPLVLAIHSVETALKGFLTLIHNRIDPFSPPLLLNLFSLAPPSTKGKNSDLRSSLYCAVLRPGVCWCAFHVHVRFGLSARWRHNLGELTTILTHGIFLCVSVVCRSSTSWFKPCIVVVIGSVDRSLLHVWSSTRTRLCTRSHSLIIGDAVLAVLCQYLRGWQCDHVCTVNVRLHFVVLPVWFCCENKIACVICFGRILQNKLFCRLLGENPIAYNDWQDDLFWWLFIVFSVLFFSVLWIICGLR